MFMTTAGDEDTEGSGHDKLSVRRPSFIHSFNPDRRPSTAFIHNLAITQFQHEADAQIIEQKPDDLTAQEQSVSWASSNQNQSRRLRNEERRRKKKLARSTELLKVQAEEMLVNQQIIEYRSKHLLRMKQIDKQREKFQLLKEQLKRRIDENGKFVAEQLNKQLRAEARYRAEKKAVGALNNDLLHLEGQLLFLDGRLAAISNEIRRQQMCKELLIKTAKVLSGNTSTTRAVGVATPENEVTTLIQKFEALEQTNTTLKEKFGIKAQELEDTQRQLDDLNSGYEIDRLNTMLTLDTQQSRYDALQNKNQSTEQFLFFSNNKLRQETIDKSMITRSIHNLLAKCKSKHFKALTGSGATDADDLAHSGSYHDKLHYIEDFILHQHAVIGKTRVLTETLKHNLHRPSTAGVEKQHDQGTTANNDPKSRLRHL